MYRQHKGDGAKREMKWEYWVE